MVDPSAAAFTAAGIYRAGVPVTIQRASGVAPNVTVISAAITAIVRNVTPDTTEVAQNGVGASEPGSISQDDRLLIVMAQDLAAAAFPLPVVKGDLVTLSDSTEILNVARVDPYKRAMAGAIELTVTGVS
jgi:hypothetical protein